jgi:hypothetical protein
MEPFLKACGSDKGLVIHSSSTRNNDATIRCIVAPGSIKVYVDDGDDEGMHSIANYTLKSPFIDLFLVEAKNGVIAEVDTNGKKKKQHDWLHAQARRLSL